MAVQLLVLLCVKVILNSTIMQSACKMLPPTLLQYILYQAVLVKKTSWIQGLVRYWPSETLSFDFDGLIDYILISDRSESHLRRNHQWFYSPRYTQMDLQSCVVDITRGLYLRAYHCHSVDDSVSENKQFIVDLRMVKLSDTMISETYPLVKLCRDMPPMEPPDCLDDDRVVITSETIIIRLHNYQPIPSLSFSISPCTLQSGHLQGSDRAIINSLQAYENVTSIFCISKSIEEFAKLVAVVQENFYELDEFTVDLTNYSADSDVDVSIPVLACRRIHFSTNCFTRHFNCAYHPLGKLESLHVETSGESDGEESSESQLEFNSDISKIIEHNCNSLLDLRISGVKVSKDDTLTTLQDTLQKCHALVVLSIRDANKGSLNSARLHAIFGSMQGLLNLKYLDVSETVNVFGDDLVALHHLMYHGLPVLEDCYLSFNQLLVYFTLLGDSKYESIQELLGTLLSSKKPSPECHTITFRWKSNQVIHKWLASLRCNVNFQFS